MFRKLLFLWGQKQESTSTWHGMYLSNGDPTEAIDVMHYCWKGVWPKERGPSIKNISINGTNWRNDHILKMDSLATLNFEFDNFNEQKVFINYKLYPETFSKKMGGDFQKSPDEIPIEIKKNGLNKIIFKVPNKKGAYRIFTFINNENGQSSVVIFHF